MAKAKISRKETRKRIKEVFGKELSPKKAKKALLGEIVRVELESRNAPDYLGERTALFNRLFCIT